MFRDGSKLPKNKKNGSFNNLVMIENCLKIQANWISIFSMTNSWICSIIQLLLYPLRHGWVVWTCKCRSGGFIPTNGDTFLSSGHGSLANYRAKKRMYGWLINWLMNMNLLSFLADLPALMQTSGAPASIVASVMLVASALLVFH